MIPLIYLLLCALTLSPQMGAIEDSLYCAFDLTIAIDFSDAMINQSNIDNLVNYVLYNFTNHLPFGTSLLNVALLTYGINGTTSISPYYDNYTDFANEVATKNKESKQFPTLKPTNLSDVLGSYLEFIQSHQRKDISAKLVLFTAINDYLNIEQAKEIADAIKSISKPECLAGSIGTPCNKIICIGINQMISLLLDIGNWVYFTTSDTLFPVMPYSAPFNMSFTIHGLIENVCTMAINAPPYKCGVGYCEESICNENGNGCYYYGTCIQGQCLYWDVSLYEWDEAQSRCHSVGASLISIRNQEFQDAIYDFMGDLEYWIGLNSLESCPDLTWVWDEPSGSSPLYLTSYTNWAKGEPGKNASCTCVSDRNISIDDYGWKRDNYINMKYFVCMKEATPPYKCGVGYCEKSICDDRQNECYYYSACIQGQCLYWGASANEWDEAKSICHRAGASLISIPNQKFQDAIYDFMGDLEYWIGLYSDDCYFSKWVWDEPNGGSLPLTETNYTNWTIEPGSDAGCACVSDGNTSIDYYGWRLENCDYFNYFLCMKEATTPTTPVTPATPTTPATPKSEKPPTYIIIIIVIAILISITLLSSFLYYRFLYRRKKLQDESNSESNSKIINVLESLPSDENLQPPFDVNQFENVNIISFPQNETIYKFNITDFVEKSCIEATTRHLVQKFKHKPSGKLMAVKYLIIPRSQHDDETTQHRFRKLLREIENFRQLWQHPNIVDFYGICVYEGQVLICMELMDLSMKSLLYMIVHKAKENVPEELVGYVAVKMIDAMVFCKANGIIHRDIKPSNILVNYSGEIKLCDFEESRLLDNSLVSTNVGTVAYWPPERLLDPCSKYDIRTDIWSLGVTLMEIILGKFPYLSEVPENNTSVNDDIEEQKSTQLSVIFIVNCATTSMLDELIERDIRPGYSPELCAFLSSCLQKIDQRPKLDALSKSLFYSINNSDDKFTIAQKYISKFKNFKNGQNVNNTNIKISVPKSSNVNINICISD